MKGLLFTYGLAYGGAVVSLFNPFVGLLIYITFAILRPETLWSWSVPAGNYSRIIGISLLVGWAANGFGDWRLQRSRSIVLSLLGFFLCMVASACFAPDQQLAWHYVEEFAKVVLPFLVGITTINSVERLRALVWVIVGSEGFLAFEMNMSYLDGFNRVRELGHPPLRRG
jgi:putative inorganic carbon (hco3(-)) transporter